jgi:DNA-binding NarL/FixJ family response regulator
MVLSKHFLIIDDHQLFSAGLQQILMTLTKRHCIHCYDNPKKALLFCDLTPISLVLLDFYIPGFDIPDWITLFVEKLPNSPVVIISSSVSPSDKKDCLNSGATAYFEKHLPPDIFLDNIKEILKSSRLYKETNQSVSSQVHKHGLTDRQVDVLIQLARGNSNKKIAAKLGISSETVKSHLSSIYKQLGLSARSEANDWAHERGMI